VAHFAIEKKRRIIIIIIIIKIRDIDNSYHDTDANDLGSHFLSSSSHRVIAGNVIYTVHV
jgi:hypothetical protein